MCCSSLQGAVVRCRVLQCVAVCCSVLPCVAVCCSVLQFVAVCGSVLHGVSCSVLQCVAVRCSVGKGACIMATLNTQRTTLIDTLVFSAQEWEKFEEIEQDQGNVPQVRFV